MFWFFGQEACGILAPRPGIEPAPPALEGKVLTTGPPGKSLCFLLKFPLCPSEGPSDEGSCHLMLKRSKSSGVVPKAGARTGGVDLEEGSSSAYGIRLEQ